MDPIPMDCVTEAPSWANISEGSSFIDTRSEPAAYYGKDVDRIMKRAIHQQQQQAELKLSYHIYQPLNI